MNFMRSGLTEKNGEKMLTLTKVKNQKIVKIIKKGEYSSSSSWPGLEYSSQ